MRKAPPGRKRRPATQHSHSHAGLSTGVSELDWWADRDWTAGMEVPRLSGLDRFSVTTRNSIYEFPVLEPETGEVLARGGRFFPEHTRARIAGCSLGGSCLKVGT